MKNLILPLKAKYFDMWKQGIKPEDYRYINTYWANRLCSNYNRNYCLNDDIPFRKPKCLECKKFEPKKFGKLILTSGYPNKNDTKRRLVFDGQPQITMAPGKEELGAENTTKKYFVIKQCVCNDCTNEPICANAFISAKCYGFKLIP